MHTLRDLAKRVLASRPGVEQPLEQGLERQEIVFQPSPSCSNGLEHDFPRKTANYEPCSIVPPPRAWNVGTSVPAEVMDGLGRLWRLPTPHGVDGARWRSLIVDCQRFVGEGWLDRALTEGWTCAELFGVADPDILDRSGLVVALDGRAPKAITKEWASVANSRGDRHYLYRADRQTRVLVWDLGRGR